MLITTRANGSSIIIVHAHEVLVITINPGAPGGRKVRIGITAPKTFKVLEQKLGDELIQEVNKRKQGEKNETENS